MAEVLWALNSMPDNIWERHALISSILRVRDANLCIAIVQCSKIEGVTSRQDDICLGPLVIRALLGGARRVHVVVEERGADGVYSWTGYKACLLGDAANGGMLKGLVGDGVLSDGGPSHGACFLGGGAPCEKQTEMGVEGEHPDAAVDDGATVDLLDRERAAG